ncbi:hypothetical protein [Spirosoma areae]
MKYKDEYPYDGLVWEVPMMENLGFAYVQTIDPRPLDTGFPSFIMKILNLRSDQPISKFDVEFFSSIDMLTSHLLFMGKPPQRKGDSKWKALGYLPITSFDRIIPESKLLEKYDEPFSYYEIPRNSKWNVYFDGSLAYYYKESASFDQVKHLGHLTHFNVAYIHHRITMEWMRTLRLDYTQYYTKQWDREFLEKQKYEVVTTILFSEIDSAIRGKAIGKFTK